MHVFSHNCLTYAHRARTAAKALLLALYVFAALPQIFAAPLSSQLRTSCTLSSVNETALFPMGGGAGAKKTLYFMPLGSLTDRLQAIAAAVTLARRRDLGIVVVWPQGGSQEFAASWGDLFKAPALPIGPFPGGKFNHPGNACILHRIFSHQEFMDAQNRWEKSDAGEILCMSSSSSFLQKTHESGWFYRLLQPSQGVLALVEPFQKDYQWDRWGQWTGIHICRSDECRTSSTAALQNLVPLNAFLNVSRQISHMPLDGEAVPRFYISSEDSAADAELQGQLWAMNLTGLKGAAVVLPKKHRLRPHSLEGLSETVADLYLLSRTSLLVGSPYSDFSIAAAAMGDTFLMIAGQQQEAPSAFKLAENNGNIDDKGDGNVIRSIKG